MIENETSAIELNYQDYHSLLKLPVIETKNSRENMFFLFDGSYNVTGFQNVSNVFHVGNGTKIIQGGDYLDYFKISPEVVDGFFDGGDGYDTLDFSEYEVVHVG
uniref:Uncharacterized protein n=1 Tax=Romanomermis culicivorax TaxID=13658 RepID=A0A915II32_ROMCU